LEIGSVEEGVLDMLAFGERHLIKKVGLFKGSSSLVRGKLGLGKGSFSFIEGKLGLCRGKFAFGTGSFGFAGDKFNLGRGKFSFVRGSFGFVRGKLGLSKGSLSLVRGNLGLGKDVKHSLPSRHFFPRLVYPRLLCIAVVTIGETTLRHVQLYFIPYLYCTLELKRIS
jgi:hypothetical protein